MNYTTESSKYYNYIKTYFLLLFLFSAPFFTNYLFLKNAGEFLSTQEIFSLQNNSTYKDVIYGSAIFNSVTELKLYSIKVKKPKIISFGSSRVLQFRESFFSKPFYNFGYTASSIHDALDISYLMLKSHYPEIILLGIDFWWFNENIHKHDYDLSIQRTTNKINPSHIILPFKWLYNKKITIRDYIQFSNLLKKPNIGIRGKFKQSGISSDGSNYYTDVITGQTTEYSDVNFNDTRSAIKIGSSYFKNAPVASTLHFQKFLELIKLFNDKGIKIILFIPPIAPTVNEEMKKHDYSYIKDLKDKFQKHEIRVYDFTEPTKLLATNDCEFIDGFHGGDILYAKILDYISTKEPILKEYINQNYLKNIISEYSGLAMIPNKNITSKKEIDFLCIGCNKNIE